MMKKKSLLVLIISMMMAVIMAVMSPVQVAAALGDNSVLYIEDVKIGVGVTADEAVGALDGYTILADKGKNIDLNQGAGGGIGSKGDRVVYLGYKMTTDRSQAITDLAVMNMKGGYSVKDYELLMERYMTEQIIPFVDGFIASIKEYRENYASGNAENNARAKYVHDALNKLTDDDCGGKGLGDLLLGETKYEMGDEKYDALSEVEKKNHADIVTIISQANGTATLIIANLLTRAADSEEDTWIDRFAETTYDDLLGFGIVMVVVSSVALYYTYRDLVDYYKFDYTPIPRYMVDEKDITAINPKGETIVIKNQSAYYKAVECNRAESDEWYETLGTSADLNGTVGKQWLALYTERNENDAPIVADSLKVVVGSADVPSDYTTGIHMFGSDAAYNLNNSQLVRNNKAKSVYVYYTLDETAANASTSNANSAEMTGSVTTSGFIALAGIGGLALGAIGTFCIMALMKKKKKTGDHQ